MTNTVIKLTKPYTKIGDIDTFKCLYALTKEVENYTGACISVLSNTIGAVAKDIYFTNDGKLDTSTLLEYAGSNTCRVVIWYDQFEFDDFVQGTNSKRGIIVTAGVLETQNGEPCVTFDNTDDNMTATIPYSVSEKIVTMLALYTRNTTSENDVIIGASPTNSGMFLQNFTNDKTTVQTFRTATTAVTGTNAISSGVTTLTGIVADRTEIKIYENGVLDKTGSDTNTDFVTPTSLTIGGTATGTLPSGSKYQFVAVALDDGSDNMAEYATQLLSRYDSTIVNEDDFIYFSDTPVLLSNGHYANGRLVGDTTFTESIKVFPWQGIKQDGFGSVNIVNVDNVYNHIVDDNYTKIDIYEYNGTTLIEFGSGEIKNSAYVEKGRIKITIKSVIDKLNTELPTGRFASTDHADLENEKKPLNLGRVNLAEPILLDVPTNTYFISDNLDGVFLVYDNGIQLTGGGVGYTETSNGFTLTANPVGRILASVDGLTAADSTGHTGTYEERISEHIPRLLAQIDIDYSQSDLDTLHTDVSGIPCTWSGKDQSVLTAINELLDGFTAYMYADSAGQLRFGLLTLPTSPTSTLEERETLGEIKAFRDTAQGLSERLKNSRNYNRYSIDEIAFLATDSDKINLIKEYKRTSISTGLHPYYKNNNVDMKSQSLGGIANGLIILDYIIALWSYIRRFYTVASINKYELNEVVALTHSQKGLENGKDLIVISKTKKTRTRKIEYTLWG